MVSFDIHNICVLVGGGVWANSSVYTPPYLDQIVSPSSDNSLHIAQRMSGIGLCVGNSENESTCGDDMFCTPSLHYTQNVHVL